MEISEKEVDKQRYNLARIAILVNNNHLTILREQAQTLKDDTCKLDEYLKNDLLKLKIELTNLNSYLDINDINKLTESIEKEKNDTNRKQLEDFLKNVEDTTNNNIQCFIKDFQNTLQKIHQQNNLLKNSLLYEQCQTAYKQKEEDLNNHLQYIENTLVPQLNQIKSQMDSVDSSLMESLNTSPFKEAIDVLPEKLDISEAAEKQPELLAASAGYDITLSILKCLSKMTEVSSYFETHLELKQKIREVKAKIETEKIVYDSLKEDLETIKNFYTIYSISQFFLNLSNFITSDLNMFYKSIKDNAGIPSMLQTYLKDLEKYLDNLNIIQK